MHISKDALTGMVIIMICYYLGETISKATGLPFPGNLLGLVILLIGLSTGVVKLAWVEKTASFLIQNLALLLVPLSVGIMTDWKLVAQSLPAILTAIVVSTFAVMTVTAKTMEFLAGRSGKNEVYHS